MVLSFMYVQAHYYNVKAHHDYQTVMRPSYSGVIIVTHCLDSDYLEALEQFELWNARMRGPVLSCAPVNDTHTRTRHPALLRGVALPCVHLIPPFDVQASEKVMVDCTKRNCVLDDKCQKRVISYRVCAS